LRKFHFFQKFASTPLRLQRSCAQRSAVTSYRRRHHGDASHLQRCSANWSAHNVVFTQGDRRRDRLPVVNTRGDYRGDEQEIVQATRLRIVAAMRK